MLWSAGTSEMGSELRSDDDLLRPSVRQAAGPGFDAVRPAGCYDEIWANGRGRSPPLM